MKERPILFSTPMVQAILAGTKTQTRRVVKLPFSDPEGDWYPDLYRGKPPHTQWTLWERKGGKDTGRSCLPQFRCPYGTPGDRLWVRETTLNIEEHGYIGPVYLASKKGQDVMEGGIGPADDYAEVQPERIKLRPSIFMPRKYARLLLEITDVRVERLQSISEADAKAEGVRRAWEPVAGHEGNPLTVSRDDNERHPGFTYHNGFHALWWRINGKDSWDANPWVWVVTFKRVTL